MSSTEIREKMKALAEAMVDLVNEEEQLDNFIAVDFSKVSSGSFYISEGKTHLSVILENRSDAVTMVFSTDGTIQTAFGYVVSIQKDQNTESTTNIRTDLDTLKNLLDDATS